MTHAVVVFARAPSSTCSECGALSKIAMARRFVAVAAVACTVLLASLLLDRPAGPAPAPASAQVEALQPDQVEHALDDLEMLAQFDRSVRADGASPRI